MTCDMRNGFDRDRTTTCVKYNIIQQRRQKNRRLGKEIYSINKKTHAHVQCKSRHNKNAKNKKERGRIEIDNRDWGKI